MLNAVRDNPERVEFVGYNTQRVRYLRLHHRRLLRRHRRRAGGDQLRDRERVRSAQRASRSGGYLLFTFLGGATFFFGPIIGAVLLVLASVLLSELTKAWLLYLGLVFLFMVMYAPGGIASLIMMNLRVAKFGRFKRCSGRSTPALLLAGAAGGGRCRSADRDGLSPPAERGARPGSSSSSGVHARSPRVRTSWLGAAAVLLVWAWSLLEFVRRALRRGCGRRRQEEIEAEHQAAGAGDERADLRAGTERPAQELRQDRDHPRRRPRGRTRASASPSSARTAPASRRCST